MRRRLALGRALLLVRAPSPPNLPKRSTKLYQAPLFDASTAPPVSAPTVNGFFMARRVALKREMNSLKKAAEEPMTKYVARAKELRDQLAAAGHTTNDEEVAAALLAGLPPDYDVIVAVLETTADKVDLDVLLGKLLTAEQRLPKTNEPTAPRAYAGAAERAPRGGGRRPPLRCFYCDQLGHMVRDCPKARADRARGANQAAGDNGRGVAMAAVKHVEAGGWVLGERVVTIIRLRSALTYSDARTGL